MMRMSRIKRPMKAPTDPVTDEELSSLTYPLCGSPKLDGFRCLVDRVPLTSSMSQFPNDFTRKTLSAPVFDGLDGELIVGSPFMTHKDDDVFHRTSGPLRRKSGEPDFKLYAFDDWRNGDRTYNDRWLTEGKLRRNHPRIVLLEQRILTCPEDVTSYEEEMLALGYEGAMIRSLTGTYKEGRCTFAEMNIFKRKPYVEIEAEIVGMEEAMLNTNEQTLDARGLSKRSSAKAGKVPKGTLGKFILRSPLWDKDFPARPGEGFTDDRKLDIWKHRPEYLGLMATVKYQKYGSRKAPRQASVIKIRPEWDLA